MAYGVNAPFGLQPRRMLTGAPWNGQMNTYYIASGYATSLFTGDPVYVAANGTIVLATPGDADNNPHPIMGVFMGCRYQTSQNNYVFSPYWPANTVVISPELPSPVAYAFVVDDPNVVYDVQSNNATGILLTDIFSNGNLVAGNGGSTITGQSSWMINQATLGAEEIKQVKILGLTPRIGNVFGGYDNVEVVINDNFFKGGTGTAGV